MSSSHSSLGALEHELVEALDEGSSVAAVTVVRTAQSVPRHIGAKMLVYPDGTTSGTVGGGEMEARAITEALAALDDGQPRLITYSLVDPTSGDPGICGGEADLYVEPHLVSPSLVIVGGGHVGRAIAELAEWSGIRSVVWDDRPEVSQAAADAGATVIGGTIEEAIESVGVTRHTSIVVVTRNTEIDIAVLPAVLASSADYVGVMGSRRRWAAVTKALADAGIDPDRVAAIHTPIGVDIGAESPAEIAISVIAEIVDAHRASS